VAGRPRLVTLCSVYSAMVNASQVSTGLSGRPRKALTLAKIEAMEKRPRGPRKRVLEKENESAGGSEITVEGSRRSKRLRLS
jgi:hypothetical protein